MPRFMLFRTDKVYLTDGTVEGTMAIAESPNGFGSSSDVSEIDGRLTFFAGQGGLLAVDARTGGFVVPTGVPAGSGFAGAGLLYPDFSAAIGSREWLFINPNQVLRYGFGGGLETIRTDVPVTFDQGLVSFAGKGWFIGRDAPPREALYSSDGTTDGTTPFFLRDENDSRLDRIQIDQDWIVGGRMLFAGRDADGVVSIFATDGTDDGTGRIALDVRFYQSDLVRAGGRFLFSAFEQGDDISVWSIDGTASGTRLVADHADLEALASVGARDALFEPLQPFVVDGEVFMAALVDRLSGPRELALFNVTGATATLARIVTIPEDASLMRASTFQHLFVDTDIAPAVSSTGRMFLSSGDVLYATGVKGGAVIEVKALSGETFNPAVHFDLGDVMVFGVRSGLRNVGLISVDLATLTVTDIMRDGNGLGDFRVERDRLYWSDADGVYVTDGTRSGTQTLATPPSDDRTAPAVIGSIELDRGVFERLGSLGADSIDVRTSRANERIDAGAGRDVVRTGSGDDRIDGGVGVDRMFGGAGDDVYLVDVARDRVIEDAREGADRIYAAASFALPANVEWLRLTGQEDLSASGGRGGDILFGNSGDNRLAGGAGDELDGGRGDDRVFGEDGNDILIGSIGNDRLFGGAGRDRIEGGAGRDVLEGGANGDLFVFARASDSKTGRRADAILDFDARDGIDLRGVDANEIRRGDQAFDYVGSARFRGDPGELRFSGQILEGDLDGDRRADFQVRLDDVARLDSAELLL